ncbi:BACON domain-containing protein, partial [Bacteroides sp. 51]|uniref:BACON domain-containing protein n=1 Tax=Bacteroides sp. 51 TaxID=2302938 RepID=UPI0013D46371
SSVYVYNYNTQGTVVPTTAAGLTDGKVTYPVVPASSTLTEGPLLYNGTAINTTTNQCVREIYIMEAENHTDNHTKAKDLLKRTCLVVGGTYGSDSEPSYYRVDFSTGSGSAQTYLDVLRNHKYTINITKVSGSGYETPDIAFRSGPVNIEASVLTWNGVGMNILTTDGQYTLAVDKDEYTFNKEAVTSKVTENVLNIWTDYTTGWKVEKYVDATNESQTVSWLKLVPATGGKDAITETYIELEENKTGASRSTKIYLEAGRIRKPVTVIQSTASAIQPGIKLYLADAEIPSGSQLTFTPKTGTSKDAKTLRVVWEPNTENVTVSVNKTCSNLEGQPISETFNGGSRQYTITTTAVTSNGNSALPTDEESTVTFRTEGGQEATVKLLQKNYGLIYNDVKSKYASATSKEYSFTVKSNTNWKIGSVTDASSVLTTASKSALETITGTSGTTTIKFTVAASTTGTATLNFINEDGLFTDVAVTLNVQPVVPAEFGGSNIVWKDGKLTFSTGPDDTSVDAQAQGVYFQWGSLVAISPVGANFSTSQILYKPEEYTTAITSWSTIPYVNETTAPFNNDVQTDDDFATYNSNTGYNASTGKGDICRYISDKGWVEGSWRLPTAAEQQALMEAAGQSPEHADYYGTPNGTFAAFTVSNANGLDQIPSYVQLLDQRFPASGCRHTNGAMTKVGSYGFFWSGSSCSTEQGFGMGLRSDGAYQDYYLGSALAVRCVRD